MAGLRIMVALPLLLITLTMLVPSFDSLRDYERSHGWTRGDAVVTASFMTLNLKGHTRKRPAKCSITYRYSVGGKTYTGNEIGFDRARVNGKIQQRCLYFVAGSMPHIDETIEISYDPKQPEHSVFLPSFPHQALREIKVGLFLILCLLGLGIYMLKKSRLEV